jgi:hypothetical protein
MRNRGQHTRWEIEIGKISPDFTLDNVVIARRYVGPTGKTPTEENW